MRLRVHFAAQDLFRAGDGERGDIVAQLLAGARYFLRDLGFRRGLLAIAFLFGGVARLVHELRGALLGLREDLGCSPAASPSAMVFWRPSMARSMGGQMNFTVNQMKLAKTIACATSVKLRFMPPSRRNA